MSLANVHNLQIPGVIVGTRSFLGAVMRLGNSSTQEKPRRPGFYRSTFAVVDWIHCVGVSLRAEEQSTCRDEDGTATFLDGYISAIDGDRLNPGEQDCPARAIARLYKTYGAEFAVRLRGSFVGLILDSARQLVFVFNDRRASRPLYIRRDSDESILICPEVRLAASAGVESLPVNPVAVAEFMIRGTFYGADTLFKGVHKLPQASIVCITADVCTIKQYWQIGFLYSSNDQRSEDDVLDQADYLLRQSVRRLLNILPDPILFFSGGRDSRLMLACLLAEGAEEIPTITWGTVNNKGPTDLEVGRQVATAYNLPHETFTIDLADLPNLTKATVLGVDGRSEVLDSPSLSDLWPSLAGRYGAFFNGDHWFGRRGIARDTDDALMKIGWWDLTEVSRIADWFKPEGKQAIHTGIKERLRQLVGATADPDPTDLKDKLFYQERLGNLLQGALASKIAWLQPGQPFLDEDLIEFIGGIPRKYRIDKKLVQLLLQRRYPEFDRLSYAQKKSLPTGIAIAAMLRGNSTFALYFQREMFESFHHSLTEIFEMDRVKAVFEALVAGTPLPPLNRGVIQHLPLLGRYLRNPVNKVHPAIGILRLLALNTYLKLIS